MFFVKERLGYSNLDCLNVHDLLHRLTATVSKALKVTGAQYLKCVPWGPSHFYIDLYSPSAGFT